MLDLEIVVGPQDQGTDIIGVDDLKKRLRISHSQLDDVLGDAIIEAADSLHGIDGQLRRCIFQTTFKRWMSRFPDVKDDRGNVVLAGKGIISLPLPPLVEVLEIVIEDGGSPVNIVDPATYVVRTGTIVGEIELKSGASWPAYVAGPRAISVTYKAGYLEYPPALKRMVGLLAAHNFLNASATLNDNRVLQINRQIQFGMDDLRHLLQVPLDYSDWGE